MPIWEDIIKEYEKLTNHYEYSNFLKKTINDTSRINRLNAMISCYYLMQSSCDIDNILKYWKLPKQIEKLLLLILQERTRINIDNIRNQKTKINTVFDFDKFLVTVENSLERNIDVNETSVKKWVFLCKSIGEKNKSIENGRSRQNNGK